MLAAIDKRYETARKYFEKASRVDAKDVRSRLHMAIALQSMGQHQSALDSYQAYLNTVPDSDEKKAKVRTLVAGLEEFLKPEPKPESVEEKPAEVAVVEPAEPEKPKEEEPEAKPVEVAVKEEPFEAVTPAEPKEETPTEPVVAVTPDEVVLPEEKPEPKGEPAEVIVIDPPVEEPEVVTPKPAEVVVVEPVEPLEPIEPKGLPVPEAKPVETLVPEESPEEPGAEPGTEVAVVDPRSNLPNPSNRLSLLCPRKPKSRKGNGPIASIRPGGLVGGRRTRPTARSVGNPVPHCRPFQRPSRSRLLPPTQRAS